MRRCTAVLFALLCLAACSGDQDELLRDVDAVHNDAQAVADSLATVVLIGDVARVRTCENHGSGPIPPTTRIDLALRDGASIDEVRDSATNALERLGYKVSPDRDPAILVARRSLTDNRGAEVRLYDSTSSGVDLIIGTALTPAITC